MSIFSDFWTRFARISESDTLAGKSDLQNER
jgi:hypothetical protein